VPDHLRLSRGCQDASRYKHYHLVTLCQGGLAASQGPISLSWPIVGPPTLSVFLFGYLAPHDSTRTSKPFLDERALQSPAKRAPPARGE